MFRFVSKRPSVLISFLLGFFLLLNSGLFAQIGIQEKLALQYFQNKEYEKAAELYQKIYSQKPSPYFYNYYLDCLYNLNDYKKAKSFVHSVAKRHPDEIKYKVEEAFVLQQAGKIVKAGKVYDKIIKSSKKKRAQVLALANAFMVRGLNKYALKTYLRALNSVKNPPLYFELADLYSKMGDYNAMINAYLDMASADDAYIDAVKAKLQSIVTDPGENEVSEALKTELLKRTQKHPNQTLYAEFLYWYSVQKKDFSIALIQAKALDHQFGELGGRVFNLAGILLANKQYDLAVEAYQYVINLGKDYPYYSSSLVNILQARFLKITSSKHSDTKELLNLEKAYQKEISILGYGNNSAQMIMNLAHLQAFYLNNLEGAKELLEPLINSPGLSAKLQAEAKLELGDIKLFSGEKWGASLLYKQVEKAHKHEPIGYKAKYKAAKFFYYVGEMEWAKVQLKVLSGATSKLIANDAMKLYLLISENISEDSSYDALTIYARADLLDYQKKYGEANQTLDTILKVFPNNPIVDNVYFLKAEMAVKQKEYALADSLFNQCLLTDPQASLADNALIERARINDQYLHNKAKAKELYKQLLMDYPGSLFTVEARKKYRNMEKQ